MSSLPQVALIRAALADRAARNERFVLLSESCAPVHALRCMCEHRRRAALSSRPACARAEPHAAAAVWARASRRVASRATARSH